VQISDDQTTHRPMSPTFSKKPRPDRADKS
jgi:hypothetical protein